MKWLWIAGAIGLIVFVWRLQRRTFIEWIRAGERAIAAEPLPGLVAEDALPPTVQAYLRKVLPGTMPGASVRFRQSGMMTLQEGAAGKPFTAEQIIAIGRPAFSWKASMVLVPFINVEVCDRLVNQEGVLEARLLGALPLAREAGPEMLKGELLRYLAEIPWAPWGFLYLRNTVWTEIKARVWQLSLNYQGMTVAILYEFDAQDHIVAVRANDRPRSTSKGVSEPTPWLGSFANYSSYQGVLLPRTAEVSWLLREGTEKFTYFKGQIDEYSWD